MIEVSCVYCDKRVSIPDIYGGKRIKCPRCANAIHVPSSASQIPASIASIVTTDVKPPEAEASAEQPERPPLRQKIASDFADAFRPAPKATPLDGELVSLSPFERAVIDRMDQCIIKLELLATRVGWILWILQLPFILFIAYLVLAILVSRRF